MRLILVLIFVALHLPQSAAAAEKVYRCGNTFSQTPCASDAKEVLLRTDSATAAQAASDVESAAAATCEKALRSRLKDAESFRLEAPPAVLADNHVINGQKVLARRVALLYNAKNSYGGYAGQSYFSCLTSFDGQRLFTAG